MNQAKLGQWITDVRMAVEGTRNPVRCPSCVRHGSLREEDPVHIDGLGDASFVNNAVAVAIRMTVGIGFEWRDAIRGFVIDNSRGITVAGGDGWNARGAGGFRNCVCGGQQLCQLL